MAVNASPRHALALLALLAASALRAAPSEEAPETSSVEVHEGVVTVRLTPEQETRLGLRTTSAEEAVLSLAESAQARVVDVDPLLALRQRARGARLELAAAKRRQAGARQHLVRLEALAKAGAAISADERLTAASAADTADAAVANAQLELDGMNETARYQWGTQLAAAATAERSVLLDEFGARSRFLLLVAPASRTTWQQPPAALRLLLATGETAMARVLDEAPAAAANQGRTWWATAVAVGLRTGMGVEAIPQDGPQSRGAQVEDAALVWHAGHRWLYVALGAHRFERREVSDLRPLGAGRWLVPGLPAGTQIVIAGAQSLLGEELRWSIPTETDD